MVETETTTETETRQIIVYMGWRESNKKTKMCAYALVTSEQARSDEPLPEDADVRLWKKSLYPCMPGGVLDVQVTRKGDSVSVHKAGIRYMGPWNNENDIALWGVISGGVKQSFADRKTAMIDPLLEDLRPLQRAILHARPTARAAMITKVVRFLSGYGSSL